ncbi:MAG: hypothetical protein WD872_13345 [Pirellulaceae bacterium]
MRHLALLTIAAASLASVPRAARAEVFVLKSGGRIEARQLNPQRDAKEPYQVVAAPGMRLQLAPAQVERVVVKTDAQKQYEALLPNVPDSTEGHWQMAEWCKEIGLLDERKRHLAEVIARDPDHETARAALGYTRHGSRWMTQEEFLLGQGYVRSGLGWKLPQQVDLDAASRSHELAEKELRRDILRWVDQLGHPRAGADALRQLKALRDPLAMRALTEILADSRQRINVRLLCLDVLTQLPSGLPEAVLIRLAIEDRSAELRDKCLDELQRVGSQRAVAQFIKELGHKENGRVNRAALCLERMGDKQATLPLINALVTTHKYLILPGGGGGINFNAASGGLSAGGKPQKVQQDHQNDQVRTALTYMHEGVNFQFDEAAWRKWYIENFTSSQVDLRRGE